MKNKSSGRIAARLDFDMVEWLEKQVKERRISMSDVLRELILKAMRETKEKK